MSLECATTVDAVQAGASTTHAMSTTIATAIAAATATTPSSLHDRWLYAAMRAALALPLLLPRTIDEIDSVGGAWRSLDIAYLPPHVERLYRMLGPDDCGGMREALTPDGATEPPPGAMARLSLHLIHPCDEGEAFFHPHQWPSAMVVLRGAYAQRVGHGIEQPDVESTHLVAQRAGSGYAMAHRDDWHAVAPLAVSEVGPTLTLMLSGAPWEPRREMPAVPLEPQRPLSRERANALLEMFKAL